MARRTGIRFLEAVALGICLLFMPVSAHGQKPDSAMEDWVWEREEELLKTAEAENDVAQLCDIWYHLAVLFKDNRKELVYLDRMEDCAIRLKSNQMRGTAMLMRLEYQSICDDTQLFLDYADEARQFMSENRDLRAANIEALVIKRYVDEGKLQTALRSAKDMLDRAMRANEPYMETYAYMSVGIAYAAGGQFPEAAAALEKAVSLMREPRLHVPETDRVKAGMELIYVTYKTADYQHSVHYCDETLSLLETYMAEGAEEEMRSSNCRSMHLYILCCYVRNYLMMNRMDAASEYLARAGKDIYPHIGLDKEFYNETRALWCRVAGQYSEALQYADSSVTAYSGKDLMPYYLDALKLRTEILADMGKWEEAYSGMKYIGQAQDSLDTEQFVMQLNELHTLYEFDKIEGQKARQRIVIIFTSSACILLALLAGIYIAYYYRLRRKNRTLALQIQANMLTEDKANRTLRIADEEHLTREMRLFRDISRLMDEEHPFTNPEFRGASLTKLFATNDKYLADAVREGAGVTVAAYISNLRLTYSLQLLENDPGCPLEEIALKSGHGTYSSFFRAFSKKFSMSPSDYRRSLRVK